MGRMYIERENVCNKLLLFWRKDKIRYKKWEINDSKNNWVLGERTILDYLRQWSKNWNLDANKKKGLSTSGAIHGPKGLL